MITVIGTAILALQTIATVALSIFAYVQIWGRKPLLVLGPWISFKPDDQFAGCYKFTIDCDLWNRRTTPIRVDKFKIEFESPFLGGTPPEYQAPDDAAYTPSRIFVNVNEVVEPSGHKRFTIEHTIAQRPMPELDVPFKVTAFLYDPSRKQKCELTQRRKKAGTSSDAAWEHLTTKGRPIDVMIPDDQIEALWQWRLLQDRIKPRPPKKDPDRPGGPAGQ